MHSGVVLFSAFFTFHIAGAIGGSVVTKTQETNFQFEHKLFSFGEGKISEGAAVGQ